MMTANDIRRKFLDYFTGKGHRLVPSDSLIPSNDPSILFTVAGMVQFKPLYVAKEKPYTRATSCQKSIRTNDIDVVGTDERHLTFFEMLGNFSFGDYFKKEAIGYGWEFLVEVLKVDPARLYVTVFEKDDEAFDLWASRVPALKEKGRIIRFGDEDNYWPAGSVLPAWVGPNGPCSEIHYDFGEDKCPFPKKCSLPGEHECDRFKEVWNLVFPQFMRSADGKNPPMEKPGIDTGMGFERLVAVIQGQDSIFKTDLFKPYFDQLDKLFVSPEGVDEVALLQAKRIVSDHSRAAVFLVSDGVVPSNEGRGYVLRRLIRRATRQENLFGGRDKHGPIVAEMVPIVVKVMGEQYPELKDRQADIQRIIRDEEERFLETVQRGLEEIQKLRLDVDSNTGKPRALTGLDAFSLYDTHGMPRELTLDIWLRELKGEKLALSPGFEKEYEDAMNAQQERARAAWKGAGVMGLGHGLPAGALPARAGPDPLPGLPAPRG
jgi:alanyl-tRNA synthetase